MTEGHGSTEPSAKVYIGRPFADTLHKVAKEAEQELPGQQKLLTLILFS